MMMVESARSYPLATVVLLTIKAFALLGSPPAETLKSNGALQLTTCHANSLTC